MTRHGADTVAEDYPDESNLQSFVFTSQPKCCIKCMWRDPDCHYTCGSYKVERDNAIRIDELTDFDRWFSGRHVCGKSPIIKEVRQELHRRMREYRGVKEDRK